MKACLFFFLLLFSILPVYSQQILEKHPRVIELETKIGDEASIYFSRRYPGLPFTLNVDVAPLRNKGVQDQESLPYLDLESDQEIDIWDDLSVPVSYLRNRVTKINVEIVLPVDFHDEKVESLKQELIIYLRLVPFRDEVKVSKKLAASVQKEFPVHYYYFIGAIILSSLIVGLMIRISASSVKTQALTTGTSVAGDPTSVGPAVPVTSIPVMKETAGNLRDTTFSISELTVNDSLKLWEQAHARIKSIVESDNFPTFQDLLKLDVLAQERPNKFGAVIHEFPISHQKKVMTFGKGEKWLEGFLNPGKLDSECLDVLDKMAKSRSYTSASVDMENVLIQIWRLENASVPFLKSIPPEHAFAILENLPKTYSLPIARNIFPGSWARLLDRKQLSLSLDSSLLEKYFERCCEIFPLYDDFLLEQFRKDKEILNYLEAVNLQEEKELYEVLDDASFIKKIRRPFYPVFELSKDKFLPLLNMIPLNAWAIVLSNSPRQYSKYFFDQLDDKRKIIFSGHLKKAELDSISPEILKNWKKEILNAAIRLYPEEFLKNISASGSSEEVKESA